MVLWEKKKNEKNKGNPETGVEILNRAVSAGLMEATLDKAFNKVVYHLLLLFLGNHIRFLGL